MGNKQTKPQANKRTHFQGPILVYGQVTQQVVLLLSVQPLLDQCLLQLHPTHITDFPTYLPQAPAGDCSHQRGSEEQAPLVGFPGN